MNAYELISKLNPILRGWYSYYNLSQSNRFRNYVRITLFLNTWRWALSKHPTLGKKSIAYKYFLHPQDIPEKILQTNKHIRKDHLQRPKNIEKWTFQGLTRESGRYQDRKKELKGKIVYLVKPNGFDIDRVRKYATPKGLRHIHAYHP